MTGLVSITTDLKYKRKAVGGVGMMLVAIQGIVEIFTRTGTLPLSELRNDFTSTVQLFIHLKSDATFIRSYY